VPCASGVRFRGSRLEPLKIPPPYPAHAGNPATLTTVAPRKGEGDFHLRAWKKIGAAKVSESTRTQTA
jgi:hypothetical protein